MTLVINVLGLLLILFIVYWFWLKQGKKMLVTSDHPLRIIVENGIYQPSEIEAKVNQPIHLEFIRRDPSVCADMVNFADFKISVKLPMNQPIPITLIPKKKGSFEFTCSMGMYRGKLFVL